MDMIFACIFSFAATGLLGWRVILPALRRLKAGQEIREVGPKWHASKSGTPTMGGLMFITGTLVSILVAGWPAMMAGDWTHIYVFLFALVFGVIGFLDDYEKVKRHQNLGLTAIQKFLLQLAAAILFLMLMRYEGLLSPHLYVPFLHISIPMSWPLYMVFAAFVIVGTVNAVNITDGLDGLSTSVSIPVALFFVSAATWWGYIQLGIFAAALLGGLLAFLLFNAHPAKVFMGDTGSLFLGGAVAGMAFAFDMPLILLLVGMIYIIETLSDILQIGYFKLTHGKRIFKMAPIHHHFEMCGWSEIKIVTVFTAVSTLFCVLALFGVMDRMM
ncbi:MAG: phospho-N-acetylmuramoyl-pentapeptide-transferase [Oscillospiraceae bacterium]|jgi:phospho-N-acetylmuramoyl-pentapeptide-transferase|nr:phospho-N-acetylmuramoyl-pentapeptide-transferase [Oscillospiraceae bacterium]